MRIVFLVILYSISTLSYANEDYTDELKSIYKQQYNLRNTNSNIKDKLDKYLYLDAQNDTHLRQRFIANLIEDLTKNNDLITKLDNKLNYIEQMMRLNYLPSYIDTAYIEELKEIYKRQLQLSNDNLYIKGRIDRNLKFDAINNTNFRQRHTARLIENISENINQLEQLDNRLIYINQMIMLDNNNEFASLDKIL